MKRSDGFEKRDDDEWYTSKDDADKVAQFLSKVIPKYSKILCPADILPDGSISNIPIALKEIGFENVRVTRDLPIDLDKSYCLEGEVVVTNPPFSLLVPFREYLKFHSLRFMILSRPFTMRNCFSVPEIGKDFYEENSKRSVAAGWYTNIINTSTRPDSSLAIGDCNKCEAKKCPANEMTRNFRPGQDRPLFGYTIAFRHGIGAFYCSKYTIGGKRTFTRSFYPDDIHKPKGKI